MKTLLISLLLTLSMLINAQIPKKANTIIIDGTLSQTEYFKQINELLFQSGYGIHNSDITLGTITTTEKSYKRGSVRLTILVKDQKVTLRGQYNISASLDLGAVTSEASWETIENTGMSGSPALLAWSEMNKIADAIEGSKQYLKN